MRTKIQPKKIGIPEAAATVGVSTRTVRRWITEGRITSAVRIGPRLIKLDPAELEALMTPVGGNAA